jgi:hypothetical protein
MRDDPFKGGFLDKGAWHGGRTVERVCSASGCLIVGA